jgi:polysaccharide biosynthesis/export protein
MKIIGYLFVAALLFGSFTTIAQEQDSTIYRLKVGDRLKIRNLNSLSIIYPDAAASGSLGGSKGGEAPFEVTIDRRGQIVMPRVGRVKVAGLSRMEAVSHIERAYSDSLLNGALFEVEITNLRIKVLGAVHQQGNIPIENEKYTLAEVIALAGGIDFTVADKTIKLIRKNNGEQVELNYDIRNLNDPAIMNTWVYDGDFVFVPPSKGTLNNIKNQRISNILQPIALTLNAVAIMIALFR